MHGETALWSSDEDLCVSVRELFYCVDEVYVIVLEEETVRDQNLVKLS